MKVTPDCKLWQWQLCSPENSWLLMLWTSFSSLRNHPLQSLWFTRLFDVVELTSAFLLFKDVPNCWFGHTCSFCNLSYGLFLFFFIPVMASFTCTETSLDLILSVKQLPNATSPPDINSRLYLLLFLSPTFYLFWSNKIIECTWLINLFSVNGPQTFECLKKDTLLKLAAIPKW